MLGGSFNTISNEVDIYDPVSNTWSVGQPFAIARRNAASDTDGTNNIWLAGGYDSSVAPIASLEIFNCPVSPCGAPSPTPTATATPSPSPSANSNGYNHTTTCVAYTIGDPATADTAAAPNTVPSSLAESALLL